MKKIKIAQIIEGLGDGGAQRIVMNYLYDWKFDNQIDVKIFVLSKDISNLYKKEISENGFNIIYINYQGNNIFEKYIYLNLKLLKELVKFKPDIIHCHMTQTLRFFVLPMIFFKNIFSTLHSNPFRIKAICYYIARIAFNIFKVIPICLNEEQAKMAKIHYGIKHYEIIHNGIDFETIKNMVIPKEKARKIFGIKNDSFVLCACGRLHEVKNYPLMLKILKKVEIYII